MKLKVCWLYPGIMDLYGDSGNIMVLEKRCKLRNIDIEICKVDINEKCDISEYDLLFLGGGADKEQSLIKEDLLNRKQDIIKAKENGCFFFLICGGYQMFGEYYIDKDGKKIEGLNVYDYYSIAASGKTRCIGNVIIKSILDDEEVEVIGFENHGGQTLGVQSPFGKVVKGYGNSVEADIEGYMDDKCIATYLHGPLLPKNPKIADYIIRKALFRNYGDVSLCQLDDNYANKAIEEVKRKINA